MRSSFSSRSLHLAFGVTEGNFEPRPAAAARRCLRPTRGGGGGGSHFFFFSFCGREQWNACHVAVDQPMFAQAVPSSGLRQGLRMLATRAVGVSVVEWFARRCQDPMSQSTTVCCDIEACRNARAS